DVWRGSAFGNGPFDACLGTHVGANAVDVIEELDDGFEGVAAVPCGEFVRGRAVKRVFHAVDIHAASAKSGCRARGDHQGMAANDYIRTFEDTSAPHHGFG